MFPHLKLVTAVGLTVVLASTDAHAKASFMAKPAMIKSAAVIAIVEITSVEQVSINGAALDLWTESNGKRGNGPQGDIAKDRGIDGR